MSYQDLLQRYGSPSKTADHTIYIHVAAPSTLSTTAEVAHRDQWAAQDIARLESYVENLRDYRRALAARYAELETMGFAYRLELHRNPSWSGGNVTYELKLVKLYADGTEVNEQRQVFPGKERRAALKTFDEMKRSRPGIETVLDIEKRQWER